MTTGNNPGQRFDLRMAIYRGVKQFLSIVLAVLIIKYGFCDTVLIKTDQMEPVIQNGDRIILSRTHTTVPMKWFSPLQHGDLIVFNHPHYTGRSGNLRIAGKPGDTVAVQEGVLSITNRPELSFSHKHPEEETLPKEYSPRDNMDHYCIPRKGESIALDTLATRDFIFLYSMILQENPKKHYAFQQRLYIDDSLSNDYFIQDFPFFTGSFNAIPDSLFTNWFFWDRLKAYLIATHENKKIRVQFSILDDELPIVKYTIKKTFYFLISDSWCTGYDSRYGGPVVATAATGKIVGILWSFAPDVSGTKALRGRRICKIIK